MPGLQNLTVEVPAPSDLFSIPIRPIHVVLRLSPSGAFSERVHVQGIVTLQLPGKSCVYRGRSDGLEAEARQTTPLEVGDWVDVVGFPAAGEFSPILQDAVYRKIGRDTPPPPALVTPEEALLGAYDSELIQIQGRFSDLSTRDNQHTFTISTGKVFVEAEIDGKPEQGGFEQPRNGSLVELTGICRFKVDENHRPVGFAVLLRTPEDIVVLKPAPWWNPQKRSIPVGCHGPADPRCPGLGPYAEAARRTADGDDPGHSRVYRGWNSGFGRRREDRYL